MFDLTKISKALELMNIESVKSLVLEALNEGINPLAILNEGLIPGMDIVGKKFKALDLYMPEVIMAAKAMNSAIEILKPGLQKDTAWKLEKIKILLGTVKGDIHDIGKNLVKVMLVCNGYEVVDLGVDVSSEKFIEAIKKEKPHLLGMSALLSTTAPYMKEVIKDIKNKGLRESLKIIVGGAIITEDYAHEIEADGYSPDAIMAVEKVRNLLQSD